MDLQIDLQILSELGPNEIINKLKKLNYSFKEDSTYSNKHIDIVVSDGNFKNHFKDPEKEIENIFKVPLNYCKAYCIISYADLPNNQTQNWQEIKKIVTSINPFFIEDFVVDECMKDLVNSSNDKFRKNYGLFLEEQKK